MSDLYEEIKKAYTPSQYMSDNGHGDYGSNAKACPIPSHVTTQRNSPCFSVYLNADKSLEMFNCYSSCGSGNVIQLCALMEGISNGDAAKKLALQLGIDIPETFLDSDSACKPKSKPLPESDSIDLARQRHFSKDNYNALLREYLELSCKAIRTHKHLVDAICREQEYFIDRHDATLNTPKSKDEIIELSLAVMAYKSSVIKPTLSLVKEPLPILHGNNSEKSFFAYLTKRNITTATASAWGLFLGSGNQGEFWPMNNRLIFPVRDCFGFTTHHTGRDTTGEKSCTYVVQKGGKRKKLCYGIDQAISSIRQCNSVIIVEGYIDVIRMHQAGFTNSIATTTANISSYQARILRGNCEFCILVLDADTAGIKHTDSSIYRLMEAGFADKNILRIDKVFAGHTDSNGKPIKDIDEFLNHYGEVDGAALFNDYIASQVEATGWGKA